MCPQLFLYVIYRQISETRPNTHLHTLEVKLYTGLFLLYTQKLHCDLVRLNAPLIDAL